jgi:long-chain acyl-CoA synthetase
MLLTVGAPLPTQVKETTLKIMGPILYEWYAASESGILTVLCPEDQLKKVRCCGQPCFGVEMEVRDENGHALPAGQIGELFSKCAGRFDEYYKNPDKTAEALHGEWFSAGDLGMRDEDNYYYIVDRKTDMIISGGENVYPREIEDILKLHPAIMDCAVFGIPDEKWGESVKALIVVKTGHTITREEIINHCNKYLAGFKRPKLIEFVEDLPRTSSGKIKKKMLRDEHWKDRERKV